MKPDLTQTVSNMEDMFYDIVSGIDSANDTAACAQIKTIDDMIMNNKKTRIDEIEEIKILTAFNTAWFPRDIDQAEQAVYQECLNQAQTFAR